MTTLELARHFREAVINIVSKEGQPGTLGTSGGTVFYNDGANDHPDRVWVRMGAENQVLVVANAQKAGLPAIAGLEVSVVKRHGSLYIDDWERNDAAAHAHDYATRNVVTGTTSSVLGTDNTVMGNLAGSVVPTDMYRSVIIGAAAGQFAQKGAGAYAASDCVLIGYKAGQYATSIFNVIIGSLAADADGFDGYLNTIVGPYAAHFSTGVDFYENTLIGSYAGRSSTGYSNTFIGDHAGGSNTGNQGICLGAYAGNVNSENERLFIGSGVTPLIYGELDDLNVGINLKTMGGGEGVIAIGDATTVPDSNPTGGGILYVESGALKYRGSSGTITVLGAA
jgi:hypothetical protein